MRKEINLTQVMKEEVKKYVKAYAEDVLIDLEILERDGSHLKEFYWMLRSSGTELAAVNHLKDNSNEFAFMWEIFQGKRDRCIKLYKINVSHVVNGELLGTLEECSVKSLDKIKREIPKSIKLVNEAEEKEVPISKYLGTGNAISQIIKDLAISDIRQYTKLLVY